MASDAERGISQTLLCDIVGSNASTYNDWCEKKRLRKRKGRERYEERDVRDFAALRALMECLGPTDGPLAWQQLQAEMGESASDGSLLALFDLQDKTASLVSSLEEIRAFCAYGHRVAVVNLGDPIGRARAAYGRLLEGG